MTVATIPSRHPRPYSLPITSRLTILLSILLILLPTTLHLIPLWTSLPLYALLTELLSIAYDHHIFGHPKHHPSPKTLFKTKKGSYTWEDVAKHNDESSAWITIEGKVYDVTEFVDRHPGGKELLLLGVGRDATDLFRSYHPFSQGVVRGVLKKFEIGKVVSWEHPVFKGGDVFYKECVEQVGRYFEREGVDRKDWRGAVGRMIPVYLVGGTLFYVGFCMKGVWPVVRVLCTVGFGVCQGLPLTQWMHDASHAAIGHSERWWWSVGRFSLDWVCGSSMLSWRNQHVAGHHVYTNVMGADPDLPVSIDSDIRRLVDQQVYKGLYRYQHLYLPVLYGLLGLKSRVQDVVEIFGQHMNGPIRVNPISVQDVLRMIGTKCFWVFWRIVVPCKFFGVLNKRQMALLFIAAEVTTGYYLAFNFQVSHVSSEADFLFSDQEKRSKAKAPATFEDEWAIAQVKTTVDYAQDSPFWAFFSGALNFQTVHHLFPTVSQYHYPKITPIVMKVAKKHGVEFNVLPNFTAALGAHLRHLREMGQIGKAAEFKLE